MEYTINNLGKLAGVSTRTLRYYDEIDLLKPARTSSTGYRIYGEKEVNLLQQILFYRELGLSLERIREIIRSDEFDERHALIEHRKNLLERKAQLEALLVNVEKSIAAYEGGTKMNDKEKFEGFKSKLIEDNEKKYGKEIREKYGNDVVEKSNAKVKGMSQEDHERITALGTAVIETLHKAMDTKDPGSDLAQKAAALHKEWLTFYWDSYSKEAHAGLAQMYVDDERFTAYYDKEKPGAAEFLRDAVLIFTGMDNR
jgi:DNA-binding transcriptional MerR regulator